MKRLENRPPNGLSTRRGTYSDANELFASIAHGFRPPERRTVAESAEKFVELKNEGAYQGPYQCSLVPYMVEPMSILTDLDYSGCVFCGPAQSGKALAIDTPIATPDGWTTMGALKIGDVIFGSDGRTTRVIQAHPVRKNRKCFEITFDDGTSIVADAEHLWSVEDLLAENRKIVDTEWMAERYVFGKKARSRFAIDNAEALECPEVDLPLDPYVLGAWLGDGHSYMARFTIHEDEMEIVRRIRAAGHVVETRPVEGRKSLTLCVDRPAQRRKKNLAGTLRELGLLVEPKKRVIGRKHIPQAYLRASYEQRMELLRGLMDTDGYCSKTGVSEFTTTLPNLAQDVEELITSLGFKVRRREKIPTCVKSDGARVKGAKAFTLSFVACRTQPPFHLERKKDRLKPGQEGRRGYTTRRFITAIREVPSVPVRCIGVDAPDHLFLAGRQMVPTHNTEALILNWIAHNAMTDPMDLIVYSPIQADARDFSIRRVDRLHRNSPKVGRMLVPSRDADNVFDKQYVNGMMLTLSYAAITQMRGRPIPCQALTDYDAMPMDVDGEGPPFDLALARGRTFESYAMTLAESSPGHPQSDPKWYPKTPHEAPPTEGILSLYNRGDRRRWYWPCPSCNHFFEGDWKHIRYETRDGMSSLESANTAYMECPICAHAIQPRWRDDMLAASHWLKEGQSITREGVIQGDGVISKIASFWLKGVSARFSSWSSLVQAYLDARATFERTYDEKPLKKVFNADLALLYIPENSTSDRLPERLMERAQDYGTEREPVVPEDVRCLVACVDVQKNAFVVQVHGIRPGAPYDVAIVDRFKIVKSERVDADGERLWVQPHVYPEDWSLLISQVMERTYPLADNSGRRMMVCYTACDSGGAGKARSKVSATSNAYHFYRKLMSEGKQGRFHLVKGTGKPEAPRTKIDYPDAQKKDVMSPARGDVPVMFLNSNTLKNELEGRLGADQPGSGMFTFPRWLPEWFYGELCVEVKDKDKWINKADAHNEAWDLAYYLLGVCANPVLGIENANWFNPPGWLKPWDENTMILQPQQEKKFDPRPKDEYDFSQFGKNLA